MKKLIFLILMISNFTYASSAIQTTYSLGGIQLGSTPFEACQIMIDNNFVKKLHTSNTNCSDKLVMNSLDYDSGKIDKITLSAMNFGFDFSASTRDIAQELFNSWDWIKEFIAVEINGQLGFTYTNPIDNVKIQVYYRGNNTFPVIELSTVPKRNF